MNWLIGTLQFRGETVQLGRRISDVHSISAKHGFSLWSAWATFLAGWVAGARADVGDEADGIALMERGLDAWRGAGTHILEPYLLALLSETCLRAGRIDAAGERLAEARAQVESSGEQVGSVNPGALEIIEPQIESRVDLRNFVTSWPQLSKPTTLLPQRNC